MQNLRKILFPFSWLYSGIVWLRNKFFDWNFIFSKHYDLPVICVGNLSVGGTGKSPMVEYLVSLLKEDFRLATLSRGYKRETSGFYKLSGKETAQEIGDEPLQFKTKFPQIEVAVDENRQNGIAELLKNRPIPEIILLDDAFQHRKVTPGFSVLLTAYDALYKTDRMLPAGNLREPKSGAHRADIVVVSKCPSKLSINEQERIKNRLNLNSDQSLYFAFIDYSDNLTNGDHEMALSEVLNDFCLVTGIAKPKPLVAYLQQKGLRFTHKRFPDHHNFKASEIEDLKKEEFILTTEKDFMRLKSHLSHEKLFYLPIKQKFLSEGDSFDKEILNWVKKNI